MQTWQKILKQKNLIVFIASLLFVSTFFYLIKIVKYSSIDSIDVCKIYKLKKFQLFKRLNCFFFYIFLNFILILK